MNKHNGFEIITGSHIYNDCWYGIARHPVYPIIVTDHQDAENDAIDVVITAIDKQLGLIK